MGGAPGSGHISIRSYNRNFHGRSGTKDAFVYLTNPIACAVIAVKGEIIDPRDFSKEFEGFKGSRVQGLLKEIKEPEKFLVNDNLIIPPKADTADVQIIKGPNIKDVPVKDHLKRNIEAEVLLKTGNNITTDDIMPAGSKVLPYRSNIPAISEFVFENIDSTFNKRAIDAKENGGGIIIGGENYGQGSSREHAAIAPMYLGIQAIIAKSFARIHRANLINFGILPFLFKSEADYDKIEQGDRLLIRDVIGSIKGSGIGSGKGSGKGDQNFKVANLTKHYTFEVVANLNEREKELILSGGLLPFTKQKALTLTKT
jgi:aconitate hydratase